MTQVSQLKCDVCGKTADLDAADGWWGVQVNRRAPVISGLSLMDQQLIAQAGGNAGVLNVPGQYPVGGPTGAENLDVGLPKSVDACSPKCAVDFVRDCTKEPPKPKKVAAEEVAVGE